MRESMNKYCDLVQSRLVEEGLHILEAEKELQVHLGDCQECFDFLGALESVDRELERNPEIEVSQQLRESTLKLVSETPRTKQRQENIRYGSYPVSLTIVKYLSTAREQLIPHFSGGIRNWSGPAIASVLVAGFASFMVLTSRLDRYPVRHSSDYAQSRKSHGGFEPAMFDPGAYDERRRDEGASDNRLQEKPNQQGGHPAEEQYKDLIVAFQRDIQQQKAITADLGKRLESKDKEVSKTREQVAGISSALVERVESLGQEIDALSGALNPAEAAQPEPASVAEGPDELEPFAEERPDEKNSKDEHYEEVGDTEEDSFQDFQEVDENQLVELRVGKAPQPSRKVELISDSEKSLDKDLEIELKDLKRLPNSPIGLKKPALISEATKKISDKSLENGMRRDSKDGSKSTSDRRTNEGVTSNKQTKKDLLPCISPDFFQTQENPDSNCELAFQEASGYWANTYVPGDPAIRKMQTTLRLAEQNQAGSVALSQAMDIQELAEYPVQPFDVPANAALGLQLSASRSGGNSEQRMLVQVGLRATDRTVGRRPALNTAIVIDLHPSSSRENQEQLRELLSAFDKAKDIGDRLRVFVVNSEQKLAPEDFRHGPISVLLEELSARSSAPLESRGSGAVYSEALSSVKENDDPNAPLGSSSVVIITDKSDSIWAQSIIENAQRAAKDGIQTSVIGLGTDSQLANWEEISISGQGSRYVLSAENTPEKIVAKEVASVSRTVARAVRLRIRLAPGVKLVGILGSYRLDEYRAEQVRQAEKSIDQRISRNLGIAADRGEDEEGIQIVIPAFLAGDTHVVLLDVVTKLPGAVADVRIRYKDLVYLKNAVATANLSLGRNSSAFGPLEQNVFKNYLAFRTSELLMAGSQALVDSSKNSQFVDSFEKFIELYEQRPTELERDSEVLTNLKLLRKIEEVSRIQSEMDSLGQQLLSDSLALAAKKKTIRIDNTALNDK